MVIYLTLTPKLSKSCPKQHKPTRELRRNNTLHEIERHRAGLGAALRSATAEVEDAEFTETETGEQVVGAAE